MAYDTPTRNQKILDQIEKGRPVKRVAHEFSISVWAVYRAVKRKHIPRQKTPKNAKA